MPSSSESLLRGSVPKVASSSSPRPSPSLSMMGAFSLSGSSPGRALMLVTSRVLAWNREESLERPSRSKVMALEAANLS